MSNGLAASDRLALSRERLRQAMHLASAPPGGSTRQRAGTPAMAWIDSLKAVPGANVIFEALRNAWAQHPLRIAVMVAADGAKALIQPLAQRHPLGLVVGALLLGGLFVRSRGWRWIVTPALLAGLLPQLVSKALTSVPPASWLAVLNSLAQAGEGRK